ncbi:MAG: sulfite exporter TauE/SafE family protein [Oligoflexia bacterium]|nr:sulfite exporter TauE/SafE family protein [Oligoflexia bacterium]
MESLAGYIGIVLMGLSLGLVGGGGSILAVPILVYVFQIAAVQATTYSLFIVGLVSAVAAYSHWKKKTISISNSLIFAIPTIVGVSFSRGFLVPYLPMQISLFTYSFSKDNLILFIFSITMILGAFSMLFFKPKEVEEKEEGKSLMLIPLGLLIGLLVGFVGAGGGFLIVPALIFFANYRTKVSMGTSVFLIALNSMVGFSSALWSLDAIPWIWLISLVSLALLGQYFGLFLQSKMSANYLRPIFGLLVLLMGVFVLLRTSFMG